MSKWKGYTPLQWVILIVVILAVLWYCNTHRVPPRPPRAPADLDLNEGQDYGGGWL